MKLLKIAVLPIILLSLLVMGGCVTTTGPEMTTTGFQMVSSFESKKATISFPVVAEKNMGTKKNPDATEKAVADEIYTELKKSFINKSILSTEQNRNILNVDLSVHYVNRMFAEWEYFTSKMLSNRAGGGQILMVRVKLRKNGLFVAQVDSFHNTGTLRNREPIVQETVTELANQIEKILKEGVSVGKSP